MELILGIGLLLAWLAIVVLFYRLMKVGGNSRFGYRCPVENCATEVISNDVSLLKATVELHAVTHHP